MHPVTGNRCKHIGYNDFDPPSWNSECAPDTEKWIDTDMSICGEGQSYPEEFWGCSDIAITSGETIEPRCRGSLVLKRWLLISSKCCGIRPSPNSGEVGLRSLRTAASHELPFSTSCVGLSRPPLSLPCPRVAFSPASPLQVARNEQHRRPKLPPQSPRKPRLPKCPERPRQLHRRPLHQSPRRPLHQSPRRPLHQSPRRPLHQSPRRPLRRWWWWWTPRPRWRPLPLHLLMVSWSFRAQVVPGLPSVPRCCPGWAGRVCCRAERREQAKCRKGQRDGTVRFPSKASCLARLETSTLYGVYLLLLQINRRSTQSTSQRCRAQAMQSARSEPWVGTSNRSNLTNGTAYSVHKFLRM